MFSGTLQEIISNYGVLLAARVEADVASSFLLSLPSPLGHVVASSVGKQLADAQAVR